ncbi:DNA-binding protein [Chromatium weissei]|nr:DNA-binding protein [Chromatium weissei]
MTVKPIRNDHDHKMALSRIEQLFNAEQGTPEGDELEVLIVLVDYYEEKTFPIDLPDPIEAIKFRMEQQSLTNEDMVVYLGQSSRVSEILSYKRKLSLNMIRNLTSKLKIPVESLISDYKLHI